MFNFNCDNLFKCLFGVIKLIENYSKKLESEKEAKLQRLNNVSGIEMFILRSLVVDNLKGFPIDKFSHQNLKLALDDLCKKKLIKFRKGIYEVDKLIWKTLYEKREKGIW